MLTMPPVSVVVVVVGGLLHDCENVADGSVAALNVTEHHPYLIRHIDCAAAARSSQQQPGHGDQRHAGDSRALPDRGRQAAHSAQQCQGQQIIKLSTKFRDNFLCHTFNI